jgi:hypothetical protein
VDRVSSRRERREITLGERAAEEFNVGRLGIRRLLIA